MFDEMPVDQFYQFLAAARTSSAVPPPHHHHPTSAAANCLSFSLHHHHHHHGAPAPLDPSSYSHSYSPPPQQGFIISPPPPLPPPPITHLLNQPPLHPHLKNEDKEEAALTNSDLHLIHHSWSNDEVLALLRIRSSLDNNWFPDYIWENVSRKLGDLGFKRSAENCKQKFEEETRSFNTTINANSNNSNCTTKNNNISTIQNYRLFGELEDLYNNHHPPPPPPHDHQQQCAAQSDHDQSPSRQLDDDRDDEEEDKQGGVGENSVDVSEKTEENRKRVIRKRKRKNKFEMFKGYCENIVNKMMAQQEDLHCKILQDMVNRDEEKIAREEAWKKKEFERIQMEMKVRAHEHAIVGSRQAKILSLLNNFTSSSTSFSLEPQALIEAIDNLLKVQKYASSSTTSSPDITQDSIISAQPTSSSSTHDQNPSFLTPNTVETSKLGISTQNPNENNLFKFPSIPIDHTSTEATDNSSIENSTKDDIGRRWPRDEVLALINIRCSHENKDNQISSMITKGIPLWERISKKMMEMGFKRNARRCKEKWENINKYFRKTKDLNKKRSIDSRTCPYFHQLSHLYSQTQSQGTLLLGTSDSQVVSQLPPDSPENRPTAAQEGSTVVNGTSTALGDNQSSSVVQVPSSLDFEF